MRSWPTRAPRPTAATGSIKSTCCIGTGARLPQLGVFENNKLASQGILASSANGANIVYAGSDGSVMIYDATAATFTVSRQDYSTPAGTAAASNYQQYVVGNESPRQFGSADRAALGLRRQPGGLRLRQPGGYLASTPTSTTATGQSGAGTIAQVDPATGNLIQPTPMVEAPLLADVNAGLGRYTFPTCSTVTNTGGSGTVQTCNSTVGGVTTTTVTTCNGVGSGSSTCTTQTSSGPANTTVSGFSRTIAPLNDQSAIISADDVRHHGAAVELRGFGLASADQQRGQRRRRRVGARARRTDRNSGQPVQSHQSGYQRNPAADRARQQLRDHQRPADAADLRFASQINAQMPSQAEGSVVVQVLTPGGTSDNFNLTVPPTSPAVFLTGVAGPETNIPTVVRASNNQLVTDSNPVQRGDTLTIYLTGCGQTSPP